MKAFLAGLAACLVAFVLGLAAYHVGQNAGQQRQAGSEPPKEKSRHKELRELFNKAINLLPTFPQELKLDDLLNTFGACDVIQAVKSRDACGWRQFDGF